MDDKIYIGEAEAYELMLARNIEELPEVGKEVLTVPAISTGRPVDVLGRDADGFYTAVLA